MQKLEIKVVNERALIKPKSDKRSKSEVYEGLRLISEAEYSGPTSIKYWM